MLVLKYQTNIPIEDTKQLAKEADKIWPDFQENVEAAGLSYGMLSAQAAPRGFIVTTTKSFNFVYTKDKNGQWTRSPD